MPKPTIEVLEKLKQEAPEKPLWDVLDRVSPMVKAYFPRFTNELVSIKNRQQNLERDILKGILDNYQQKIEQNQIFQAFLIFVDLLIRELRDGAERSVSRKGENTFPNDGKSFLGKTSGPRLAKNLHRQKLSKLFLRLESLLEVHNFKEADRESLKILLLFQKDMDIKRPIRSETILTKVPIASLQRIDNLWQAYSDGKFGFGVQREIWYGLGGTPENFRLSIYEKFGEKVGWYRNDYWLNEYDKFNFDFNAPVGHLPSCRQWQLDQNLSGWWEAWKDNFSCLLKRSIELE